MADGTVVSSLCYFVCVCVCATLSVSQALTASKEKTGSVKVLHPKGKSAGFCFLSCLNTLNNVVQKLFSFFGLGMVENCHIWPGKIL